MRNLIENIRKYLCKQVICRDLWAHYTECQGINRQLMLEKNSLERQISELQEIICNLQDKIEQLKPPKVNIPTADITYRRPVLVEKNKYQYALIDVRLFVGGYNHVIYNRLKANKLLYSDNPDTDVLIPKIYQYVKRNYRYMYDANRTGITEFWEFPWETMEILKAGKGVDCDGWSILIGAHFAMAGIPRDRWFVSAGMSRAKIGHATVYARDSSGVWRHLNSTTPHYRYKNLKDYPSNKDSGDMLGIAENGFWFSFNDVYAIHKFESVTAAREFKNKLGRRFSIKRRRLKPKDYYRILKYNGMF